MERFFCIAIGAGIAAMLYVTAIVIGYKLGVKHGKESSHGDR